MAEFDMLRMKIERAEVMVIRHKLAGNAHTQQLWEEELQRLLGKLRVREGKDE